MGFFDKIAKLINGSSADETPKAECQSKSEESKVETEETPKATVSEKATNSIDKQDNLLRAVIQCLKSNYGGSKISMADKTLALWITDGLFYDLLSSNNFKNQLMTSIVDELGLDFSSIEIMTGRLPEESLTPIADGCFLQIKAKQVVQSISRAEILQVEGFGSMQDASVCLDSQEIVSLPYARYNIGIGRRPKMDDNTHRINQIAIDDSPTSEEYHKNKFVSRAHAFISYSEEYGFLLNVEHGGSRMAKKRTHIYRGIEKIELDNVLIPVPLHDGDYIVLSKNVHLLFKKAKA